MRWFCDDCEEYSDEPALATVDLEEYYGVGGSFPDHHTAKIMVCPICGSEAISKDYSDEEEEEEPEEEEDEEE